MATRGFENVKASDLAKHILPKRSKYRAVKTTVDGITFDSKKEAQRYHELKLMEKAGHIRALELQPRFPLWVHTGLVNRAPVTIGEWRADFSYEQDCSGGWVERVEDVKGFKTALYRWKKKHFEAQYGIEISEI